MRVSPSLPAALADQLRPTRDHTVRSRGEHTAMVMRQALRTDGDSEAVLAHFVGQMSEDELTRLRDLLARRTGQAGR
jgi:hypothetical protein